MGGYLSEYYWDKRCIFDFIPSHQFCQYEDDETRPYYNHSHFSLSPTFVFVKVYRIYHIQYLLFMVQEDALLPSRRRPSWCLLRLFLCLNKHLLLHCSQHTDLMQIIDINHVYNFRHYPLPFTTILLRLFILTPSSTDIQIRRFNWVVQRWTVHRLNDILKDDIMPHGNKIGMDYNIQLSTKNYELRKLH